MKKILLMAGWIFLFLPAFTQTNVPVVGVSDERPGIYGLKNALVVTAYDREPQALDILIDDGRIRSVGKELSFPEGCQVLDLEGKTIYPSFVDLHGSYGLPAKEIKEMNPMAAFLASGNKPGVKDAPRTAEYWNRGIHVQYDAVSEFRPDSKQAEAWRKAGFGAVSSHKQDGIARGSSVLVSLADKDAHEVILAGRAGTHYSFSKGSSKDTYPTAQYGAIALLRQLYLDAQWYGALPEGRFHDEALESVADEAALPRIFEARGKYEILRAKAIADEFGFEYLMKGAGDSYQLLDEIRQAGVAVIVPLSFPSAPDVKDPYDAASIALSKLKHWELAPANAGMLAEAGIEIALTGDGLKKPEEFLPALRKAVKNGLNRETALKALTTTPSLMLGVDDLLGSIEEGKIANLLVCSGDIFEKETTVLQNWVQGKPHTILDPSLKDLAGPYVLMVGADVYSMVIRGKADKPTIKLKKGDEKVQASITRKQDLITIVMEGVDGKRRLSGALEGDVLSGEAQLADGRWFGWRAAPVAADAFEAEVKKGAGSEGPPSNELATKISADEIPHPFRAYGWEERPVRESMLFRNATVWTLDERGKIEGMDVLVEDGRITSVGEDLKARGAREIDATGMHLTPGIIDEHSHIAMASTNEFGQAISSEVRVGDVIDPSDMSIYRQLSGGVTAAHILHGSANPIGGQSVLIKHRWGATAEEMKIEGQVGFLKHALGENVKRTPNRYPNTRMGVEHLIRDGYLRAMDYRQSREAYEAMAEGEKAKAVPPRRDLELEALVDVLEERSFICCHTYVQSEAMMIMRLAEDLGIKAHTLIHMNEGFKLADKIREHGAAASVFADWWDYKYEVYEGINYNAATLVQQGVLTCINSDNAEMGRRLNQEAAKTMKYGGLDEVEALKLVTLNPAKILHLDHRMGSIEAGKDADLVLWNGHPLSVYSRAKMTLVDGTVYFDEEKDAAMKAAMDQERMRIIQKILNEKKKS